MSEIGMHEAKTTLSKLVERAERGEEIILTRNGKPVAQLTPVKKANRLAEAYGAFEGTPEMPDVELPEEFQAAFGMK